MDIKTEFDINNIVKHKFSHQNHKVISVYEVIEIQTITCSAGTQNFYICRILRISKATDYEKDKEGKPIYYHEITPARFSDGQEYCKFREDELIIANDIEIKILTGEID